MSAAMLAELRGASCLTFVMDLQGPREWIRGALEYQRPADCGSAPRSPSHSRPQTHWEWKNPCSPRAPRRCAAPVYRAAPPHAISSACGSETHPEDISA